MTLPALAALRARFPDGELHLIGNATAAPLAELAGLTDGWTSFDAAIVGGLFRPDGPGRARGYGPLGAAVAWCADPEGILRANLTRLGASDVILAPSRPPDGARRHVADYLVDTLGPLLGGNIVTAPIRFAIPPPLADAATGHISCLGLATRRFIAIHPGSGSAPKNWPAERFAELIERLPTALGAAPLVLAGPAEGAILDLLCWHLSLAPATLRDRPLAEVAAVLGQASAYVGNDSGLTHLAAMLGVPTLSLFGPTDPELWAPRGRRVRVLRHNPLAELDVESVLTVLRSL